MRYFTKATLALASATISVMLVSCSSRSNRSLAEEISDSMARKHFRIRYDAEDSQGTFYVYGDGRLVLQRTGPEGTIEGGKLFTCTGRATPEEIDSLIQLMDKERFTELPQNGFPNYDGAVEQFPWRLHTISIKVEHATAQWVFYTGEMNGTRGVIPPNFTVVEDAVRRMRTPVVARDPKLCPLAPEVKP